MCRRKVFLGLRVGFFIFPVFFNLKLAYAQICYKDFILLESVRYDDFDHDGILNKDDSDIDGDHVLNLIDLDPCAPQISGSDTDHDGILDHLDFRVNNSLIPRVTPLMADLQKELWDKGIYINNQILPWTEEEVVWITEELFQNLDSYRRNPFVLLKETSNGTRLGLYRDGERTVFISAHEKLRKKLCFQATLTHEFFHVLERDMVSTYDAFNQEIGWQIVEKEGEFTYSYNGGEFWSDKDFQDKRLEIQRKIQSLDFPSEYSKLGPKETFSEVAAASYLILKGAEPDRGSTKVCSKYDLNTFRTSHAHKWFVDNVIPRQLLLSR